MKALNKLRKAGDFLEKSGIDNPRREAELIITHCLGTDRVALYKENPEVQEDINSEIDEFLGRRSGREPLQYILGYTEFCGLKIKVGPGILIPRPETELLAEETIKVIRNIDRGSPPHPPLSKVGRRRGRVLDLCTGSGCLALAIAKEFSDATIYGTDSSESAIGYARENAGINGILNAIFLKGSLFEPIRHLFIADLFAFDLILSNPPYIKRGDIKTLQPEIREWEPTEALDGGEDGLDYYRIMIPEAGNYLRENGFLMFEVGMDQALIVKRMAQDYGFSNVSLVKDYAGIERILVAARSK
jgi:release factor glutamine methyltransferase